MHADEVLRFQRSTGTFVYGQCDCSSSAAQLRTLLSPRVPSPSSQSHARRLFQSGCGRLRTRRPALPAAGTVTHRRHHGRVLTRARKHFGVPPTDERARLFALRHRQIDGLRFREESSTETHGEVFANSGSSNSRHQSSPAKTVATRQRMKT